MVLRSIVCTLVALACAIATAPARATIPSTERAALIALYNAAGGASWNNNQGWNGAVGTECDWDGVHCDDAQSTVTGLYLSYNNLIGTIPPITAFTNLEHFDVNDNTLSGPLPALTGLSKLQYFNVLNNGFSGPIPSLAGLKALQYFNVDSNHLNGPFPVLDGLSNLQVFDIGGNHQVDDNSVGDANGITGTIPPLSPFTQLTVFYVSGNKLSGSLPDLSALKALQDFEAEGTYTGDGNHFQGTLQPLTGLSALQVFSVRDNQLTGNLPSLQGLSSLQAFVVSGNKFNGKVPDLTGLTNLVYFSVYDNALTGQLPSLSGLTQLQVFSAGYNKLDGQIPPFNNVPALIEYDVDYNALTGPIPPISGLTKLQYFDVTLNHLSNGVPSIGGMTALQYFYVGYNQLSGHIPDLSATPSLIDFQVLYNNLDGPLPSLAGLTNLEQLVVDDNALSGDFPSLAGLSKLKGVYAGNNAFTGAVPTLTGSPLLQRFYFDGNQLDQGGVPDLTGLTQLQYFSVAHNQLAGTLPSLSTNTALISFDASYNRIGGTIPSLAGLSKLQTLYLGFNKLTGSTPALAGLGALQVAAFDDNALDGTIGALAGAPNLTNFVASNNQLTGQIPSLAGSPLLLDFNVSMNRLGGNLPPDLSGLTQLTSFDASNNGIGGTIPSLAALKSLQQFYVGFNHLTGQIPPLQGLTNLQYFAVDDNQLSGQIPTLTGLTNLVAFLAASNALTGQIPSLAGLSNLQLFQVGNNRLDGNIPSVPSPDNLSGGLSSLCPNNLVPSTNTGWDDATGQNPWYSTCSSNESLEARGSATSKDSGAIAFSHDGTIEVFQSQQTDLTPNGGNAGGQDVYSFANGAVQLENVDAGGNKLIGVASAPAISPDGRSIAFLFVPNATVAKMTRKDFATGQMWAGGRGQPKHQVDVGMAGVPANGSAAGAPTIASVGGTQQIAFCSSASNLVPNDANGARDIFLADPLDASAPVQRISVDGSGSELAGDSCEPKLSSDGSRLVFSLSSTARFGTASRQIMLKQLGTSKLLLTGAMLPITAQPNGQGAPADSNEPSVSADGSVIAFSSSANLDGLGAPVGGREVFVSLAQPGGRLLRRARAGDGTVPDGASQRPQVSDDGTTVVMQTAAHNFLTPKSLNKDATTPPPQCGAVAVTTNFFSVSALGGPLCNGATQNQAPSISGDGTTSGFASNAPQSNGSTNYNAWSQGFGAVGGLPPALSGDYSGQWYDPNQSGQGLVIDVLNPDANNNRAVLVTWFVAQGGAPTWLQGVGVAHAGDGTAGNTVVVQMPVTIFHGKSFPLGEAQAQNAAWGTITLTFDDANTGSMTWRSAYPGFNSGAMALRHFLPVALPASTTGSTVTACYSGNWFNAAEIGHGFEFEVLAGSTPQLAVDWFAYAPNGDPVWLYGVGPIVGNQAQMTLGIIGGPGAQFPPAFSAASRTISPWGTATFTFADATHATVAWNSTLSGYGSGSEPLAPLLKGLLDRRGCQ